MAKVVGLGAGGHARVLVEAIRAEGVHDVVAMLDADEGLHGSYVGGVPVKGGDALLPKLKDGGVSAGFVGVGSVGNPKARVNAFSRLREFGFTLIDVIHPSAVVAPSTVIGDGAIITANATINPDVIAGDNVIVNSGAIIEHDCVLGDHVHVAPGATVGGGVVIREGAHVGIGSTIREGIEVGRHAIVGAGSVVVNDVPSETVVVGVPARPRTVT